MVSQQPGSIKRQTQSFDKVGAPVSAEMEVWEFNVRGGMCLNKMLPPGVHDELVVYSNNVDFGDAFFENLLIGEDVGGDMVRAWGWKKINWLVNLFQ